MALPLSLERFFADLRDQSLLSVHFLQTPVLVFEFLHALHQGSIHAAALSTPLIKRRTAHAMFTAKRWDGLAILGRFQDGQYLAIGKSRLFYAKPPA